MRCWAETMSARRPRPEAACCCLSVLRPSLTVSARTPSFSPSSVMRWTSSADGPGLAGGTAAGALGGVWAEGAWADAREALLRPTRTEAPGALTDAEPSLVAETEAPGAETCASPSAVAETLAPGALIDTLPLSSTETPTPGAWMETGESEPADGVDPEAGVDGFDEADESVDEAGTEGADGESVLTAGSACVPMWRGM